MNFEEASIVLSDSLSFLTLFNPAVAKLSASAFRKASALQLQYSIEDEIGPVML
jgi:hypothetical protein